MSGILTKFSCGDIYWVAGHSSSYIIDRHCPELIDSVSAKPHYGMLHGGDIGNLGGGGPGIVFGFILDDIGVDGVYVAGLPSQFDRGSGYFRTKKAVRRPG